MGFVLYVRFIFILLLIEIVDDLIDVDLQDLRHFLHVARLRLALAELPTVNGLRGDPHFLGEPLDVLALF